MHLGVLLRSSVCVLQRQAEALGLGLRQGNTKWGRKKRKDGKLQHPQQAGVAYMIISLLSLIMHSLGCGNRFFIVFQPSDVPERDLVKKVSLTYMQSL